MSPATAGKVIEVKAQNGLRKEEVAKFLKLLHEQREIQVAKLAMPANSIGVHSDHIDAASSQEASYLEESKRRLAKRKLQEVDAAIARIFAGTFGMCTGQDRNLDGDECTGKITPDILKNCPTTDLCQHCLKEQRARERKQQGFSSAQVARI